MQLYTRITIGLVLGAAVGVAVNASGFADTVTWTERILPLLNFVGGAFIRAITMVEVDGKHEAAVMKRLLGMPEVRQLHNTNGRWDMVAELEAPDVEAFDDLLRNIRQIDGIASTDTSILLKARRSVG